MVQQYKLSRGATVNLGNFESARVDLEVTGEDVDILDRCLKSWLEVEVGKIQDAAGLPPRPVERFTGGEE